MVGVIGGPGGGDRTKPEEQPPAKQLAHAPEPALPSPDEGRDALPIAAMTNGRRRMHGGTSPGAPKSNGHALEHGRYTAEAIAGQREFAALVRDMKGLVEKVERDE